MDRRSSRTNRPDSVLERFVYTMLLVEQSLIEQQMSCRQHDVLASSMLWPGKARMKDGGSSCQSVILRANDLLHVGVPPHRTSGPTTAIVRHTGLVLDDGRGPSEACRR